MGETTTISNGEIYNLLKTVVQQNKEIKEEISLFRTHIETINKEIIDLKSDNEKLRAENRLILSKVNHIDRQSRANNLIFYNIQENNTQKLEELVADVVVNKLKVNIEINDISNVYRIGKRGSLVDSPTKPILVKFTSSLMKREILRKAVNLKGTYIAIAEDLIPEDREQRKLIYSHYKAAKLKNYPAKLYKNKVVINGVDYYYEDLKEQNTAAYDIPVETQSHRRSSSLPATPNPTHKSTEATYLGKKGPGHTGQEKKNSATDTRAGFSSKPTTSSADRGPTKRVTRTNSK